MQCRALSGKARGGGGAGSQALLGERFYSGSGAHVARRLPLASASPTADPCGNPEASPKSAVHLGKNTLQRSEVFRVLE